MTAPDETPTPPFHDLDTYVGLPRVAGLALDRTGGRLVVTVAAPDAKGTAYATALWEIDPTGERPAHRLTRSRAGESAPAFAADGDLWFVSSRPDPGDEEPKDTEAGLWRLPAAGGEAEPVLSRPGGVGQVRCARDTDRTVVSAPVLQGAGDEEAHAELHRARKDAGVTAILHEGYPVRHWDRDLGPASPRLFVREDDRLRPVGTDLADRFDPEEGWHVSPDGRFALVAVRRPGPRGDQRHALARVDLGDGSVAMLLDEEGSDHLPGPVSPDANRAVVVHTRHSTPEEPPHPRMSVLDLATGTLAPLAPDWDAWPEPVSWSVDGSAVLALADLDGRRPVFRVDVDTGAVTRVTGDDAAYTELVPAPDGTTAYAVRSSYAFPPEVVLLDLASGEATVLRGPAGRPELPGRLEEVRSTAPDGVPLRAWLALPHDAGPEAPAPLLLWVHGGPIGSWNAWSWRWNPWLLVARGYAVLLPDPALSTGYGQDFIQRGWGAWGEAPYDDLMAITDEVEQRADVDADRTAAMGGSFGGYMANWIAGHTDRFDAIVTHASLWALEDFAPTTDGAQYWAREMTRKMTERSSPHRAVASIVSPVLVIHGDKDYRVPIHEGLRLWWELLSASGRPAGDDGRTDHRFLYFPDENHWVLAPQHAKVWYQVVIGFLARHVLGEDPGPLPDTLGTPG